MEGNVGKENSLEKYFFRQMDFWRPHMKVWEFEVEIHITIPWGPVGRWQWCGGGSPSRVCKSLHENRQSNDNNKIKNLWRPIVKWGDKCSLQTLRYRCVKKTTQLQELQNISICLRKLNGRTCHENRRTPKLTAHLPWKCVRAMWNSRWKKLREFYTF